LFGNAPEPGTVETCDTAGVIAPIIDIVASYQVTFALQILTGQVNRVATKMLQFDPWELHYSAVDTSSLKKTDCPACGQGRFEFLELRADADTVQTLCGRDSVQIQPVSSRRHDLAEWAERWRPLGEILQNPFLLKLKLSETGDESNRTLVLFPDGRLLVQGTNDPVLAKSLYARYVGN